MTTVDASIPLQAKAPDMVGKIRDLISLRGQQAQVQQQEQTARQRANLANFDFSSLVGDDGTIDMNKIMTSGLRQAAGDQFPEVMQGMLSAKQHQIASKQALVGLKNDQRSAFSGMIGSLRSDPDVAQDTPEGRQKVEQSFQQFQKVYGDDVKDVVGAYMPVVEHAPQGKLAQAVQTIQLQATSADSQASRQAPQYTDTGQTLQQTNPYAQKGQAPDSIALGISPGSQESVINDQLNNPYVLRRDARGNIDSTRPLSGGGSGDAGPAHFGVGERQAIEQQVDTNFKNVNSTRSAAQSAPQLLDQVHKARELAAQVQTGAYSDKKQKLESAIGSFIPGFDGAKDDATKYDLLNKFLTRISADSASVLGKNDSTDAARESIREQFGHTGQVNTAIGEVLKYTESQIAAVKAKADAQEKWLSTEGNGIRTQHQFETQWRQAYDPVVYQLEGADSAERKKIINGLSKEEAASLSEKRKKLREMGAL